MLKKLINKATTLLELPVRVLGPISKFVAITAEAEYRNQYSIVRQRINRKKGVSALIRAKNEEQNIELAVANIIDLFSEIIIVDNGSTDSTKEKVKALEKKHTNIRYYNYPFTLKKCGVENSKVEGNSVYSLTHFYNWSMSKCNFAYIMKWDADMVLDKNSKPFLAKTLNSLRSYWPTFISTEQQTIYIKDGKYYESNNEINAECMIFPNRSDVFYIKSEFFELLSAKMYKASKTQISDLAIYEIKRLEDDEFSHWDTINFPTERKKMEYKRFNELKSGIMDNFRLMDDL